MASNKEQVWFGMKLRPEQKAKIERLARERGLSQKAAVMRLVEEATQEPFEPPSGSVLDGLEGVVGAVKDAPRDLSSNPRHLSGYGRD